MISQYYKTGYKSGGNYLIKPFQLYLRVYSLAFGLFSVVFTCVQSGFWLIFKLIYANNIENMPSGDHCALWGCDKVPRKAKGSFSRWNIKILLSQEQQRCFIVG